MVSRLVCFLEISFEVASCVYYVTAYTYYLYSPYLYSLDTVPNSEIRTSYFLVVIYISNQLQKFQFKIVSPIYAYSLLVLSVILNRLQDKWICMPTTVFFCTIIITLLSILWYNDYDVMEYFRLNILGMVRKFAVLFRGHKDLIEGFNTFFDSGYKLEVQPNNIDIKFCMLSPAAVFYAWQCGVQLQIGTRMIWYQYPAKRWGRLKSQRDRGAGNLSLL